MSPESARLTDQLKAGLDAPICLTWEITYGCNLACIHCLSSSGRRDPRELSTAEAMAFTSMPCPAKNVRASSML